MSVESTLVADYSELRICAVGKRLTCSQCDMSHPLLRITGLPDSIQTPPQSRPDWYCLVHTVASASCSAFPLQGLYALAITDCAFLNLWLKWTSATSITPRLNCYHLCEVLPDFSLPESWKFISPSPVPLKSCTMLKRK